MSSKRRMMHRNSKKVVNKPSQKLTPSVRTTQKVNVRQSPVKVRSNELKTSSGPKSAGIFDDVLSTAVTVGKNVVDLVEGNPLGLVEIPNSILKVVDTSKNVIRNLTQDDAKTKVVIPDKTEITRKEDQLVLDRLKENMPVMTTTQIPGQYSYEMVTPPMNQSVYFDSSINRNIHRFTGTYNAGSIGNGSSTPVWRKKFRCSPGDATFTGPRLRYIAGTFQMYRWKSITMHYIPFVGTDSVGMISLNFNEGTDLLNQFQDIQSAPQDVSQREHNNSGPVRTPLQLTVKGRGEWKYLYSSAGSEDLKWFSDMTAGLLIYASGGGWENYPAGQLFVIYDVEFCSAMDSTYSFYSQLRQTFLSNWVSSSPVSDFDLYLKAMKHFAINSKVELKSSNLSEFASVIRGTERHLYLESNPREFLKSTKKSSSWKPETKEDLMLNFIPTAISIDNDFLKKTVSDFDKNERLIIFLKSSYMSLFGLVSYRLLDFAHVIGLSELENLTDLVKTTIINMAKQLYDDRHPTVFDDDECFALIEAFD